ncbi:MAG: aldolase/citrate lyase family protein [Bryobacteraceae bacterium]|nr:aldolase/citrate lyase family protein [Bryobacteraceae bacterium]
MKQNRFKRVVDEGRIPVGHMIMEFGTRGMAMMLKSADVDFVFLDMEHTGFDTERIADLCAWLKATDVAPFVRVPQGLYHFLARTMDAGALGVMVANVETAEQAKSIVNGVKYLPLGYRGLGLGTAHNDYVQPETVPYLKAANENTTVICQIESPVGLENCDAIAATAGVDVLWVGHFDLSNGMGIPADFQNPRFLDALKKVVEVCAKHGKRAGIQPGNEAQADQWIGLGFNAISWGTDISVYRRALGLEIAAVRSKLGQ